MKFLNILSIVLSVLALSAAIYFNVIKEPMYSKNGSIAFMKPKNRGTSDLKVCDNVDFSALSADLADFRAEIRALKRTKKSEINI